jgi:hypothetical protein
MNINSVIIFLKERRYLVVLLFIALLLAIITTFLTKKPVTGPVGLSWQGIIPGKTSERELLQKLGNPLSQQVEEHKKIFSFSSENQYRPNEVITLDSKVVFIKQPVVYPQEGEFEKYLQQFGQPDKVLFGPHSDAFFDAYIFLKQGLVLMANKNDGTIIEKWYFKPTSLENFLQAWGQELSETKEIKF